MLVWVNFLDRFALLMLLRMLRALALCAVAILSVPGGARAQKGRVASGFVVPAGLESAVEFWKQIFARHDSSTVIFFDPLDPVTVYASLRIADNPEGRIAVEKERRRILSDYDLDEEMGRLRAQRGTREQFLSGLRIAGRYLPEMKSIFREAGLPTDLAYLPLVESSFNLNARSPVGATGIWQFMPDTGKKFLRVDDTVDERRDPISSTRAAARLLKENFQILGSWPLAITAYNHGTEGMFRAIQETGSRDLAQIIRRYKSPMFGYASQNFYAEFLAAVDVAKNSERLFPFLRSDQPIALREIALPRPLPLKLALQSAALSPRQFYEWNPALNPSTQTLPAGFRVKLVADKSDSFMSAGQPLERKPAAKSQRTQKASSAVKGSAANSAKVKTRPNRKALTQQTRRDGGTKGKQARPVQLAQQ